MIRYTLWQRARRRARRNRRRTIVVGIACLLASFGFLWGDGGSGNGRDWGPQDGQEFIAWLNQHGTTAEVFLANHPELASTFGPEWPRSRLERRQEQVVALARSLVGSPYVWGADGPDVFDCSGLLRFVFAQIGIDLPHRAAIQATLGASVSLSEIQPGDLVAFGSPVHHIGIFVGSGRFLHAPYSGATVTIDRLSDRDDLTAIRRVL